MRTIKKTLKVKIVRCRLYDTVKKQEKVVDLKVTQLDNGLPIPENCIIIEKTIIEEKELVYTMKPEDFVKHATVEEKK